MRWQDENERVLDALGLRCAADLRPFALDATELPAVESNRNTTPTIGIEKRI